MNAHTNTEQKIVRMYMVLFGMTVYASFHTGYNFFYLFFSVKTVRRIAVERNRIKRFRDCAAMLKPVSLSQVTKINKFKLKKKRI